jgi:hypothetical protein
MTRYLLGPALCAAMALAACSGMQSVAQTASPPSGAPAVPSGSTVISADAQKSLYAAETAYNVPAHAYVTLLDAGSLPANIKAKAKPALQAAYQALKLARQAAAVGDSIAVMLHANAAIAQSAAASAAMPTGVN